MVIPPHHHRVRKNRKIRKVEKLCGRDARKNGVEEENIERVEKNECDVDESRKAMNISEAKFKFKSTSSSAPVGRSVRVENQPAGKKHTKAIKETAFLNLPNNDTDECDGDGREETQMEFGRLHNKFGGRKGLKDPFLLAAHIFKSGMAARPRNPYHVWICSTQRVWPLYLPKHIIAYYLLKISDSLLLVDEQGNKWEAKIYGGTDRMSCSGKEWGSLCKTNLVDIGDVCLCEFMQGSKGIQMLVRVIRAHTLTRKMSTEEENIERVDVDSEYESSDDESLLQINIPCAKHKFKSGSPSAPVSRSVEIQNKYDNTDESDGDDSEMEMDISKAKHKLKSSHASVRQNCIFKSGMAAQPKNPYHVWRCSTQRVWPLYLPKRITRYYQLKISDSLFLVDERGNKWEAKIIMGGNNCMACPGKAWGSLLKTNFVDVGDVCLCEFVQGSKGIQMLVSVIRAHTLTRKMSTEEENIEPVDVCSEYESDDDDESPMQINIPEAKHKFKSGSSSEPVSRSVKIENKYDDTDESDRDDSETEMDISKVNHKLKSSHAPVRRSGRMRNTCGNEESAEDSFEKIDKEALYSDPHEEMRWKRKAQQKKRETQDAYTAAGKKRTRVLKEMTYLNLSDDETAEGDGDDGETEMDISKEKHKLKSSCAPVRRCGRILKTFRKNNTNVKKLCGRDAGIFKFGPGSPYFEWNPSTVRGNCRMLHIPIHIVRECEHLRTRNSLFLIDERGNEWETRIHKDRRRVWFNTKEWHRLCKKNRVRTGDVCVCELVQGHGRLCIHVRVIRFAGKRSGEEEDAEKVEEDEESVYKNVGGNQEELKDPYLIAAHIFKSGMAVRPKNPYYLWRFSGQNAWKNYLPKRIITYYQLKFSDSLLLVDERGNKWEAKMVKGGTNGILCSAKAWVNLCKMNFVDIGDVCLCELVEGSNGIHMLVRVIRAHTLTRKKGGEEEHIERVGIDSESKSDDDESPLQMNIPKAKHKFKSGSSSARVSRSVDIENKFVGKKCTSVIKETNFLNLSDDDTDDESDDSEMEMDISKEKHKLESSFVQVRRSGRIHNAYAKKKRVEFSCEHDENESSECDGNIKPYTVKPFDKPNRIEGKLIGSLCLPKKLEWLHSYFKHVHEKDTIAVSFHDDVFGKECKTYIFLEHLEKFCLLEPITDCCIIAYMWYLHRKMERENILDRFRFVNLNYVSRTLARDQRTRAVFDRLTGSSTDQLVLVPCNVGSHWILTAIHPYSETVFYLDSLYFRIHDEDWRDIVNDAISMFSASRGEKTEKKPSWKVVKAARQPDSKQCGFYVMLYMREIIEIFVKFGLPSLELKFKGEYSRSEIDEVRAEWAEGLIDHLGVN